MTILIACLHAYLLAVIAANLLYLRRWRRARPAASHPGVSICIPARNEEANLQRLLPSLLAQDYPAFEVIVYDDASEDGTANVLAAHADPRLTVLHGDGPPPGWVGKVHALYQATRAADQPLYLFLDADTELRDAGALRRIVDRYTALPGPAVLTSFPALRGGGLLLVSLVPSAILAGLPWPLVPRLRSRWLSALNGQCWLLDRPTYHRLEPHAHHRDEVLEDVEIGRYLKDHGVTPYLVDLRRELAVYMYDAFGAAWNGFRKNAYLLMGGTPAAFALLFCFYALVNVLAPLFAPWLLASVYLLKGATDRAAGFPWWVTALTPVSHLLALALQLHSAVSHWAGRVAWKGRDVRRRPQPAASPPARRSATEGLR